MKAYLLKSKPPYYYGLFKWQSNGKQKSIQRSLKIPIDGNNLRRAKTLLEQKRVDFEKRYENRQLSSYKASEITFIQYFENWLEERKHFIKPSTYSGYLSIYNKYIKPFFIDSNILLFDLTPSHIQSYYNYVMDKGLNPNSIRRHHANIRKSLQDAVKQRLITYNPADCVDLPHKQKALSATYDSSQIQKLIKAVSNTSIETAVMLAAFLGLRRGEVCGLKWSDVDLEKKIISIRNTRVTTHNGEVFQASAKTESSIRDLPINDELLDYLKKTKKKQNKYKKYFGNAYDSSDFVCVWFNGKPLKADYISNKFNQIIKKNKFPHIRFHDLRHSCATNMLTSGVSLKIIQEILGHSSMSTTANFYLHPDIEQKKSALDTLSHQYCIK